MLERSFVLLNGIGRQGERSLWQQSILSWIDFLNVKRIPRISPKRKAYFDRQLLKARYALREDDASFIASCLPRSEHWRLYQHFRDDAVFLDIETGRPGRVMLIGMYDGFATKTMLRGDKITLQKELSKYKILVTFNGSGFDVPVLERYFNIKISLPHIDLFHVCRKIELTGGLKAIEKELGIARPKILQHVNGQQAAELWRCFMATGDQDFLDMLIAYNEEDCANLKTIADMVIPLLWEKTYIEGMCT